MGLNAYSRSGTQSLTLASIVNSGASPLIREFTDSTISNDPLVNEDYFYQISIGPQMLGWSQMEVRAVKINYTY